MDYKKDKKKKKSIAEQINWGGKYEDGGVAKSAKMNALMDLKSKMNDMGGESLAGSFKKDDKKEYADGGLVKASVMAKDKEGLKEGLEKAAEIVQKQDMDDDYEGLSKEDLIKMLKNR